jgi:hypothetical protein
MRPVAQRCRESASRVESAPRRSGTSFRDELGPARTGELVTSGALILMFAFLVLSTSPGYEVKPLPIGLDRIRQCIARRSARHGQ